MHDPTPARPHSSDVGADDGQSARTSPKHRARQSYERYHERVDASDLATHVRFMNYGYESVTADDAGSAENRLRIPGLLPNREAAALVGEVVGPTPTAGKVVVDVGCGRGGALWLLGRDDPPRASCGVDLSPRAARAAARALDGRPGTGVCVADAEALPFATGSVDVVLNVESSLHYPSIASFYAEVARILRPGGTFCYADLLDASAFDAYRTALADSGLQVAATRDITANVVAARRHRAERQRAPLDEADTDDALRFVGAPGTGFFDAMDSGALIYALLRLVRDDGPPRHAEPDPRLRRAADRADALLGTFDGR